MEPTAMADPTYELTDADLNQLCLEYEEEVLKKQATPQDFMRALSFYIRMLEAHGHGDLRTKIAKVDVRVLRDEITKEAKCQENS